MVIISEVMKKLIIPLLLVSAGCNKPVKTQILDPENGQITTITTHRNQKTERIAEAERTKRECYEAVVDIEKSKITANPAITALINKSDVDETALLMGAMMIQNQMLIDRVVPEKMPIQCASMSYYEYLATTQKARHGMIGKIATLGLAGFLGAKTIDGLSEDRISVGDDNTFDRSSTSTSTVTNLETPETTVPVTPERPQLPDIQRPDDPIGIEPSSPFQPKLPF